MGKLNLLTILNIKHIRNNQVIWEASNLRNILHTEGEEYILKAAFVGGAADNEFIPTDFFFGMDARTALTAGDEITDLVDEPSANGYSRQAATATDGFEVSVDSGGFNRAVSPIVTFAAAGGDWGPVKNLFFTDKEDNSGLLIASVALGEDLTLTDGDTVSMRMGLSLQDVPE
jgi:hypothetical protein